MWGKILAGAAVGVGAVAAAPFTGAVHYWEAHLLLPHSREQELLLLL